MAGVGAAGTILFVVMAATQVLGVSAVALISQAAGRKDRDEETLVREAAEALRRARAAGGGHVAFNTLPETAVGNDGR